MADQPVKPALTGRCVRDYERVAYHSWDVGHTHPTSGSGQTGRGLEREITVIRRPGDEHLRPIGSADAHAQRRASEFERPDVAAVAAGNERGTDWTRRMAFIRKDAEAVTPINHRTSLKRRMRGQAA